MVFNRQNRSSFLHLNRNGGNRTLAQFRLMIIIRVFGAANQPLGLSPEFPLHPADEKLAFVDQLLWQVAFQIEEQLFVR